MTNRLRLEEMDTPMLRNEYRRLRDLSVRVVGYYTPNDFDRDVTIEAKERSLPNTPRGYVTAAHHWYRHIMSEAASYEDYLLENVSVYDTIKERNMDREEN